MNRKHDNDDAHASNEEIEQLKRCLSKISFASTGFSKRIDSELAKLRKILKSPNTVSEIVLQVEAITEQLMSLDDNLSRIQDDAKVGGEQTYALLCQNLNTSLTKLIDKSGVKNPSLEFHTLLSEINRILKKLEPTTENKKGFFDWFKRGSDEANSSIPEVLPEEIRLELAHTLKQVDLPERFEQQITLLENRLSDDFPLNELADIVEQISRMVLDIANENQAKFEAFLVDLNARLSQVQEFLEQSTSLSQRSHQASQHLNRNMHDEMESLKNEMQESKDLPTLKQQVDFRINNLLGAFTEFQTIQTECFNKGETQIATLQKRLKETEAEMQRLKQEVIEQRKLAQIDALTSLPNRHMYLERLEQEYNRWRRYRSSISLVMCDIDYFKKINDEYGHLTGDTVIKEVAQFLRNGVRESDFLSRYGGEEFVILMPETGLADATKAVNKLRQNLQKLSIHSNGMEINVTASFGVAEFFGEDTTTDVFARADRALYRAKDRGRNQVCCELHPDFSRTSHNDTNKALVTE
ncbi:MAG: diguanylate cyclase [Pseudomonadota bacterium]